MPHEDILFKSSINTHVNIGHFVMKTNRILNNISKLTIRQDDKEILNQINLNRNLVEDGLIWEAWIVSFRIWLPNDYPEGVIDICYPVGEDNTYGFLDVLEAIIKKDSIGVYRLSPRNRGEDIPKHFYSIIDQNLLLPISMGAIIPYQGHVFGKGMVCKVADIKTKTYHFILEEVEIISPLEHAIFIGSEIEESLPEYYENIESNKYVIDYKGIIEKGENEKREFKSSARWDYKRNCLNKEIHKSILKTIAGFLNTSGGELFIGVDDDGNILGLEKDIKTLKKKNLDGYRLFLSSLISDYIGKEFNLYTSIEFPDISGYNICLIRIKESKKEAFVKDNNKNKFYIRTQNSTRELDPKETYEYISSHRKKGSKALGYTSRI